MNKKFFRVVGTAVLAFAAVASTAGCYSATTVRPAYGYYGGGPAVRRTVVTPYGARRTVVTPYGVRRTTVW